MSFTDIDICNLALSKIGGAGDQVSATGQITSLTDTDKVSVACALHYPKARLQVFIEMAKLQAPATETVKQRELDDELVSDDVTIEDISVSGTTITVTTGEVHGKSTGDTVVLKGIDGTEGIYVLNDETYTITVLTTTTFTLDSTTGSEDWTYDGDSGVVSRAPALGPYTYAFNKPTNAAAIVRVTDELFSGDENTRHNYRYTTILNKDDDGELILTNDLTNADGDGIYIEHIIDQTNTTLFSLKTVDAIATLLASDLSPVVGRNTDMRVFLLAEYNDWSLPEALAFNQSQQNVTAERREDFRGGRAATLPRGI